MSYGLTYTPYNTNLFLDARGINPDAAAFIAAAGITGTTEVNAVNALVVGLKADGLWTKMKAVYPFVTDNVNLFGYTTTFTSPNYVTDSTATFTLNNTTAPDGSNTGVRFTAVGSNNNYFYSANTQGGNNFGTGNKAFSIYVKAGTFSGSMSLGITSDGSTTRTNFSLTNDWQRITITRNVIVAGNSAQYYIDISGNSMTSGQYFYIWAPQFENGTTATTYQPIATTQQAYIASQFKYNLKDPRDLDAAFRLVFNGGWTHSSTGALPNGTNGYADTKLICQTSMFGKDYNFGYYSRTDSDGVLADIGNFYTVGTSSSSLSALTRLGNTLYLDSPNESLRVTAVNNNSLGYYISNNATSIGRNVFKNNSKIINTAFSNNDFPIQVNPNIALSASHIGNIQGGRFSNRQLAFANFGSALTDTEVTALNSRIITFQTALSRQV